MDTPIVDKVIEQLKALPHELQFQSLNALRNYLNLSQNDDLRNGLSRALPLIKSQAGMTVTLNLMTRIIWDVWLRHVGMGRNEHLQVCVRPPNSDMDNSGKLSNRLAGNFDPLNSRPGAS